MANSPRRCLGLRRGLFSRRPRRCFIACSSALATAGGTLQWSCTRWRASRAGAVPRCGPPVQAIRLRWAFSFSPLPFFHALRRFALACGVFPVAMVPLYISRRLFTIGRLHKVDGYLVSTLYVDGYAATCYNVLEVIIWQYQQHIQEQASNTTKAGTI